MNKETKTQIDYLESHSLSGLLNQVNEYNKNYPDSAILKDDIVEILKEEDTFILLYYK